jgi:hypothetical protein
MTAMIDNKGPLVTQLQQQRPCQITVKKRFRLPVRRRCRSRKKATARPPFLGLNQAWRNRQAVS